MIVAFNEVPAISTAKEAVQSSQALIALLLRAFGAADPGSRVMGSVFHFSDGDFAEALGKVIGERGIHLHLVAGDVDHGFSPEVRRFFSRHVERGGVFQRRPLGRRNHDKWFLFEHLDWDALRAALPDGARVVGPLPAHGSALFVGTGNLTREDRDKNNAAILIPIGASFAVALGRRFETLRLLYRVPRLFFHERFRLFLFPRLEGGDTVRELVERARPGAGALELRVCSNRWNRTALAEALLRLYREAPDTTRIDVIARGPDDRYDLDEDGIYEGREMTPAVAAVLAQCATRRWQRHAHDAETGALLTRKGVDKSGQEIAVPLCVSNIHSKYVLLDGPYGESAAPPTRRLVWVGSPNMVQGALATSFEILVELKDEPGAYTAFLENFGRLTADLERGGLGATDPPLAPGTA